MSLGEYRPLPVMDDQRRPIVLVSMHDIVGYLLAFFPQEGFNFPPSPAHRIGACPGRRVSAEGDSPGSAILMPYGKEPARLLQSQEGIVCHVLGLLCSSTTCEKLNEHSLAHCM